MYAWVEQWREEGEWGVMGKVRMVDEHGGLILWFRVSDLWQGFRFRV